MEQNIKGGLYKEKDSFVLLMLLVKLTGGSSKITLGVIFTAFQHFSIFNNRDILWSNSKSI